MAAGQSALLSAMGYKPKRYTICTSSIKCPPFSRVCMTLDASICSPQRRTGRNESALQDFSMSPYPGVQPNLSSHQSSHLPSSRPLSNQTQSQSLLFSSPKGNRSGTGGRGGSSTKFTNLPSKSLRSGLVMVSPVPTRFSAAARPTLSNHNKLDISTVNGPVPISPIGSSSGVHDESAQFGNRTLPLTHALNSTQNTFDFGNQSRITVQGGGRREATGAGLVVAPRTAIEKETQITIIGFPAGL